MEAFERHEICMLYKFARYSFFKPDKRKNCWLRTQGMLQTWTWNLCSKSPATRCGLQNLCNALWLLLHASSQQSPSFLLHDIASTGSAAQVWLHLQLSAKSILSTAWLDRELWLDQSWPDDPQHPAYEDYSQCILTRSISWTERSCFVMNCSFFISFQVWDLLTFDSIHTSSGIFSKRRHKQGSRLYTVAQWPGVPRMVLGLFESSLKCVSSYIVTAS